MTPKVAISEIGTTIPGIIVARALRRNRNTTMITSEIEMISESSTSRTEARIVVVRSITTLRLIAGEIEAPSCGSAARTRSTVSIMFAPGWRNMMIKTAFLPSTIPAVRTFSTESLTSATSDN